MKKIIITVSDNPDKKTCSVKVNLEDNKRASKMEVTTASNVYHAICEKLQNLKDEYENIEER